MNIREKIEKLLRLSESPNENEAQAALLKARKLMMENKLTKSDIKDTKQEPIEITTEITYTKRTNYWLPYLLSVIAKNHSCVNFDRRNFNQQTRSLRIYGYPGDAQICNKVFKYAVDNIFSWIDHNKKEMKKMNIDTKTIKSAANSFAEGFIYGLEKSYEKQTDQHSQEWGLVAIVPPEIKSYTKKMKVEKGKSDPYLSPQYFNLGFKEGENFSYQERLE